MSKATIAKPFIINPFISKIHNLFDDLRFKNKEYGNASCLLLTGESGSGKSAIAEHYADNNPVIETSYLTRRPILHYELKSVASPVEFLRSILVKVGDPQGGLGARNKGELFERLVTLIKTTEVELIILDEIQVIIERRSASVLTGIADLFKDLIKETKVPIVFMGMPWSRYLIDSNQQLKRRISYRHVVPPYRISTKEDKDDYRRLLKLLAEAYGLNNYIKLEEMSVTLRFFSATSGNLAMTADLISEAFMMSEMESKEVNVDLFACVLESYGVDSSINSFLIPIENLVLRELVVNSDWHFGYKANRNSIIDAEYVEFGVTEGRKIYSLTG